MEGGEGFLIVYAINSRNSFTEVREFHELILRVKDEAKFPTVVVGNKCDMGHRQRKVEVEEGENLCKELGVPFLETSAKNAVNVEEAFYTVVREMRRRMGKKVGGKGKGGKGGKGKLGKKECVLL